MQLYHRRASVMLSPPFFDKPTPTPMPETTRSGGNCWWTPARAAARLLRARRKLPGRAGRLLRTPRRHATHRLPAGRRRVLHGGGIRKVERAARRLPGLAGARRGERDDRVHTAFQDSTPMLLCIGQNPLAHRGREGFQELHYEEVYAGVAKRVLRVSVARDVPGMLREAWASAVGGRRPVVLELPEDMLRERVAPPTVLIRRAAARGARAVGRRGRALRRIVKRGRAPAGDLRRRRVDAARKPPARRIRRTARAAGGMRVSPPGHF